MPTDDTRAEGLRARLRAPAREHDSAEPAKPRVPVPGLGPDDGFDPEILNPPGDSARGGARRPSKLVTGATAVLVVVLVVRGRRRRNAADAADAAAGATV
ncbi:hypothetical protein [Yinghuangia soli]|uniref:Uncharacterized protein n=1 Tax=Yinghuangia soli TaxID=2908204 RepID=A0AA41U2L9_9ACTN|nr:hypothetical protein [Yinghuangia soli]MCF2528782.1 hypothetical protein [Yinghuangia soli]